MDEQDLVFVRDAAQFFMEPLGWDKIASFALNRFNNNCGDFFGRENGFEQLFLENLDAFDIAGGGLFRVRAAVAVGVGNVLDGQHGVKAAALNDLAASERKRTHRAAMKSA